MCCWRARSLRGSAMPARALCVASHGSPRGARSGWCCARASPELPRFDVLGANFAVAGLVKIAAAALLYALLFTRGGGAGTAPLLTLSAIVLVAATLTTHAAARLDSRAPLLAVGASALLVGIAAGTGTPSRLAGLSVRLTC